MNTLRVGRACNNNCIVCRQVGDKCSRNKSLAELQKELFDLRQRGDHQVVLPCNIDCRSDFFDLVSYAKSLGLSVTLRTNGRMFAYEEFNDRADQFVDAYEVLVYSLDGAIADEMTRTPGSHDQASRGVKNLISRGKNVSLLIPATRKNAATLPNTVKSFPVRCVVHVANPHPAVYAALQKVEVPYQLIDIPKEVKIEVTAKCNLDCAFCFNQNAFSRDVSDLPLPQLCQIVNNAASAGVRILRLTGGEPLLRKDILELLTHAYSRGMYTILNTNSVLLDPRCLEQLRGIVGHVLISLHTLDAQEVQRKAELIRLAKELGIRVEANTVLTHENIGRIREYCAVARQLAIPWFMLRPVPTASNPMPLTSEDVAVLLENLLLEGGDPPLAVEGGLPFCSYKPEIVKQFSRGAQECGIFNKIAVGPDGRLKPCYSIPEDIGTPAELIEGWNQEPFRSIRQLTVFPESCKRCEYVYDCLGGCRFAAKLVNGSYEAMDPLARPEEFLR